MLEIDPVVLGMACILSIAFCIPFVYQIQKNKKKLKKLNTELQSIADISGACPDVVEIWRHRYALGLDSSRSILVYLQSEPNRIEHNLDLKQYKKVNLVKTFQRTEDKKNLSKLPDYIGLELIPKSADLKAIAVEFYDGNEFSDLQGETVLAEKWAGTLNSLIQ